jgi:hypothetical protein
MVLAWEDGGKPAMGWQGVTGAQKNKAGNAVAAEDGIGSLLDPTSLASDWR